MSLLVGNYFESVNVHGFFHRSISGGYGATFLNALRCNQDSIEFPLTLGRDFSGTVVHKGMAVRNSIELSDKVWGVVPIHRNGCHSEFVAVDADYVRLRQPKVLVSGLVNYELHAFRLHINRKN